MAIKWSPAFTRKRYKFDVVLLSQTPYTFLLRESLYLDHTRHKSLTNAIDEVLEHLLYGIGPKLCTDMQIYQWREGEGLFKVGYNLVKRFSGAWSITDVKWTKIANDLKAFEVLYA